MFKNKLAYLLFCAIFWVAQYSFGQQLDVKVYKDSIKKLYDASSIKDYQKSIPFLERIYKLSTAQKDTVNILLSMHIIGRKSQFISENYRALEIFNKELKIFQSIQSDSVKKAVTKDAGKYLNEIEIYLQLGNSLAALGNNKTALEYYYKGYEITKQQNDEFYLAVIPILIGNMEKTAKNFKKSIIFYKQGIEALENSTKIDSLNANYNLSLVYASISDAYLSLDKIDSSKIMLAISERKGVNDFTPLNYIDTEHQKAKILIAEEKYKDALLQLKRVKKLAEAYNPKAPDQYYYRQMSLVYNKLQQLDSAIIVLEKGLNVTKQNTKEFYLTEDYKSLAKLYKKAGNLEKSNKYYEKYVLNQAALDKSKQEIINTFHNKELEDLTQEKEKQQKTTSYIVLGCIFIIGFLLLYLFSLSKKRKKEQQNFETLLSKVSSSEKTKETKIVDTKEELKENKISDITEETTQQILSGLQKLEEQEYYLKQECNSYNVAKKIKTNTSYLSKVINAKFDKNFNTYINDLRINYALIKLKEDTRFRSYSIKSIAEELGYKSADSFSKYFKFRTGLQPSVYIKKLNKLA